MTDDSALISCKRQVSYLLEVYRWALQMTPILDCRRSVRELSGRNLMSSFPKLFTAKVRKPSFRLPALFLVLNCFKATHRSLNQQLLSSYYHFAASLSTF